MNRGNLVLHDTTGKIFAETGEATGNVVPHEYPVGIPYIEIPYGMMQYDKQRLVGIDVTKTPHEPIFKPIERPLTLEEQIAKLENDLLIAKGAI